MTSKKYVSRLQSYVQELIFCSARLQIECGLRSVIYALNATTLALNLVSLELSQILLRQYFMLRIHSIFNTKATTDMAFTAQPWAGNGEDKGSSSLAMRGDMAMRNLLVEKC